jgi:4-hydroxythreonine-4-phosphate dehydrogenase
VVHGDAATLHRAAATRWACRSNCIATASRRARRRSLELVEIAHPAAAAFGQPDPANAESGGRVACAAPRAPAWTGECDGLVTGPVHKAVINEGGIPSPAPPACWPRRPAARW